MLQSEPGDGENPSPPSEENCEALRKQTPQPKRVGLPLQFWLWQCMPLICLMIVMPPGEDPGWWFFTPTVQSLTQQQSSALLAWIVFCSWLCQGMMLALWQVWGPGKWYGRLPKVVGLFLLAVFLPVIWFIRHFVLWGKGVRPWSEVLNPLELLTVFGVVSGVSFLPAMVAAVVSYALGYRLVRRESAIAHSGPWQFSIAGLCKVTVVVSLLLTLFRWVYPELNRMFEENRGTSIARSAGEVLVMLVIGCGAFMATVLTEIMLAWRNWKITLAIFSVLVVLSFGSFVGVAFSLLPPKNLFAKYGIDVGAMFVLGHMIALRINGYWLRHQGLCLAHKKSLSQFDPLQA